jgi:polysaccharide pyruvyl transferase WcaK-like protein
MLHGSGPGLEGAAALERWTELTNRPFGIFGVTLGRVEDRHRLLLQRAAFVFTRETASLEVLAEAGVGRQNARFVPDAALATDMRDDAAAQRLMTEHDLEEGRFVCIVPRLRKTPYHLIYPGSRSEAWIRSVTELNEQTRHTDHDKLLDTIVRYVREGHGRVLLCPEMTYAVDLMDELLLDRLPKNVACEVAAMRRFWLPDEAASIDHRAQAVVSIECHSPLLAIAGGTPAFCLRQPEDGIKGCMYTDLGLTRCVFDIEQVTGERLSDAVLGGLADGSAAHAAAQARRTAEHLHTGACASIASALHATPA